MIKIRLFYPFIVVFVLLFLSCNNNTKHDKINIDSTGITLKKKGTPQIVKLEINKSSISDRKKHIDKTIYLGFQGFDGMVQQPKSNIFRISKSAFLKYKNSNSSLKVVHDSTKVSIGKLSFAIKTAKGKIRYSLDSISKQSNSGYVSWQSYIGFYSPLKLYVIRNNSEGEFGFSKIDFVDSLTNKIYELTSNSDGESSLPIFSPNQKFMAFYSVEDEAEFPESVINITKIVDGLHGNSYKDYAAFNSGTWLIDDLVWIDNSKIAIKAQTIKDVNWLNKPKKYIYFQYTIPKLPLVIKYK